MPSILRRSTDTAERLLDRILCVLGAVAFSQFPEFVQQYLQRLEGHLDEARLQLANFSRVAQQAGMSLADFEASLRHSAQASSAAMADAIASLSDRVEALASADSALRSCSALTRPFVFLAHLDPGIARATWGIFRPAVPTTAEGLAYAVAGMVAALAVYHLGIKAPIVRRLELRKIRRAGPA